MATNAKPAPRGGAKPRNGGAQRASLILIAVVVSFAALYWLRDILTPLALAIFLAVMIESFTRFLNTRIKFLPEWAALALAVLTSVSVLALTAWIIAANARSFVGQIESYLPRLNAIVAEVSSLFGASDAVTINQIFERVDTQQYLGTATQGLQSVASVTSFLLVVLIYLGFIVASRVGFERKIVGLFPERDERKNARVIFERVRDGIERYLWVQTVTGLMIALASWGVMAILGLDNAFFWAFLIFVAGYIPIVGPIAGGLLPPIFALVQFNSYWQPLILFVALAGVNFFVGNVIYPRMQSDSLNLDPVAVLLALALWGAIWGVAGMFLSTPLTVMMMVVVAQFKTTSWIAVLISKDGDPLGEQKES